MAMLNKKPLDTWTVREQLTLASSVLQSGDQNWVSVSRAIRNQSDSSRPPDFFSQKNCALQYGHLLEKVETPKRKRTEKNEVLETPGMQVFRKLTLDRIDDLKQEIRQDQDQYKRLTSEIEMVASGHCDDQLAEIWEQIQKRQKEKDEKLKVAEEEKEASKLAATHRLSNESEDNSTRDSLVSQEAVIEVDDKVEPASSEQTQPLPPIIVSPTQPTKMLTDLLQSKPAVDRPPETSTEILKKKESTPSAGAPTLKKLLNLVQNPTPAVPVAAEVVPVAAEVVPVAVEVVPPAADTDVIVEPEQLKQTSPVAEEVSTSVTVETSAVEEPNTSNNTIDVENVIPETDSSINVIGGGESISPNIPSKKAEPTSRSSSTPSTPIVVPRRSSRVPHKSGQEEEKKKEQQITLVKQASAAETSDDEDASTGGKALTDSQPASPASIAPSETEEEKTHKAWKKSIMLVWRSAANHRYANVFMHQVTDEIAPGYSSCVFRPMSLSLVKKNVENNIIRTTMEFQRDMMLMFTNAIMYNSADHDVYQMAQGMYNDILKNIEQFVNTQAVIVRDHESKPVSLRGRRSENSESRDTEKSHRRRASSEQEPLKKRKTRADD